MFEGLCNELLYDIFEYLDVYDAFGAFNFLNQRFRNLFHNFSLPIKINISSISKSAYEDYLRYIIKPHPHRIDLLRICHPFAGNLCISLFPLMQNFTQLTTFMLDDVASECLVEVIDALLFLPLLSSLTIQSRDHTRKQNEIYEQIFRLQRLNFCQLFIPTRRVLRPLTLARKNFSPIQHLVIKNKVLYEQLESLLSYVPQLHSLALDQFDRYGGVLKSSIALNHLKSVSLKINSLNFNDFEQLIGNFFSHVESLHLSVETQSFAHFERGYLNAYRWRQLICTSMTNLRIFDFRHQSRAWNRINSRIEYENQIQRFHSAFWMERQWFFDSQYYLGKSSTTAVFYSTNPYRYTSCFSFVMTSEMTFSPCFQS